MFAGIDHLARQQPPLNPPFVDIVEPGCVLWRAHHQLRGLRKFLLAAKQLDLCEDVAGVAMQLARHRFEQGPAVGGFSVRRDARLGQRDMAGAQPFCGPQGCGLLLVAVEQRIHPRLVIARRQQRAEQIERGALGILRHRIVAPGLAHQPFCIGPIAACDHYPCQREPALGRHRRFVFEPRPYGGVVAMIIPQACFDAPAQEGL